MSTESNASIFIKSGTISNVLQLPCRVLRWMNSVITWLTLDNDTRRFDMELHRNSQRRNKQTATLHLFLPFWIRFSVYPLGSTTCWSKHVIWEARHLEYSSSPHIYSHEKYRTRQIILDFGDYTNHTRYKMSVQADHTFRYSSKTNTNDLPCANALSIWSVSFHLLRIVYPRTNDTHISANDVTPSTYCMLCIPFWIPIKCQIQCHLQSFVCVSCRENPRKGTQLLRSGHMLYYPKMAAVGLRISVKQVDVWDLKFSY